MIKCEICGKEFKNNLGGNLTFHRKVVHNISAADYYIQTELNGIEPRCQCGLCEERPNFYRGKFSKYAIGHEKHDWQQKRYIELHGQSKCQNPDCNSVVPFYRGKPRKYCCHNCSEMAEPCHWNQEQVKNTVKEKYDMANVFQLKSVKEKSKITMIKKFGVEFSGQSEEIRKKSRETSLIKYGFEYPFQSNEVKEKQKQTILKNYGVTHFSKTKKFREIASQNMCRYNDNAMTNHKIRYYKDTRLYYQSLYEYRFLEYCEKHDLLKFLDNSPTFKYLDQSLGKWHLPDFKFKDIYIIEIKSTYWMNRQGGEKVIKAKRDSVESNGYKYIFLLDENYDNFIKIL